MVGAVAGIPRWHISGQMSEVEVSQEPRGGLWAPGSVDRDGRPGWCEAAGLQLRPSERLGYTGKRSPDRRLPRAAVLGPSLGRSDLQKPCSGGMWWARE